MDNTWTQIASHASKLKDEMQTIELLKRMREGIVADGDYVDANALAAIAAGASKLSNGNEALELLTRILEQAHHSPRSASYIIWSAVAIGAKKLKDDTHRLRMLTIMLDHVFPMGSTTVHWYLPLIVRGAVKLSDQQHVANFLTHILDRVQGRHDVFKSYTLSDLAWCANVLHDDVAVSELLRRVAEQADELTGDSKIYVLLSLARAEARRGNSPQALKMLLLARNQSALLGVHVLYNAREAIGNRRAFRENRARTAALLETALEHAHEYDAAEKAWIRRAIAIEQAQPASRVCTYEQLAPALEQAAKRKLIHQYKPMARIASEASGLEDGQSFALLTMVLEQSQKLYQSSRPLAAVAASAYQLRDSAQATILLREVMAQVTRLDGPIKYPALAAVAGVALRLRDNALASGLLRQVLEQATGLDSVSMHKVLALAAASAARLKDNEALTGLLEQITELTITHTAISNYSDFWVVAVRALQMDDRKQATETLRELASQTKLLHGISKTLTLVATHTAKILEARRAARLLHLVLDHVIELDANFQYNPLAAIVTSAFKLNDPTLAPELWGRIWEQTHVLDKISQANIRAAIARFR